MGTKTHTAFDEVAFEARRADMILELQNMKTHEDTEMFLTIIPGEGDKVLTTGWMTKNGFANILTILMKNHPEVAHSVLTQLIGGEEDE